MNAGARGKTAGAAGGGAAFESRYAALYGPRWEGLRQSLLRPPPPVPYGGGLTLPYYLDRASVLAALSPRLPAGSGVILDACAAPGGKSLVIASRMGPGTELLSNELSAARRRRLAAALDKHLDETTRRRVRVSGFDAAALAARRGERGRFAAVLLDAPCSSEGHVLRNAAALEAWTAARPRFLARRQWALLSAAFLLLAPGGSLVYATCSINPEENDGVARRLMEKYGGPGGGNNEGNGNGDESGNDDGNDGDGGRRETVCVLDRPDFPEGEETAYGRIILPDREAAGPMYVARWRKR
ncbi:MAG: 16S rRNA methyltransferase [Treponema sp.]|jgi:16S rRNA (cytosine1407-C5)-methyltransferase|nr:16S rRNA methyltransferase [Treponema sp.]